MNLIEGHDEIVRQLARDDQAGIEEIDLTQLSYAETVFTELLGDSDSDNLYCFDCGSRLLKHCLRNF